MSMLAHAQRLPSGRTVRYAAPDSPPGFPTDQVVAFVRQSLGGTGRTGGTARMLDPDVVSDNQAIFAFTGWRDWLMPDRVAASGLTRWDYRHGLLSRLARTSDPATMAAGLQHLQFGPVDVLVLKVAPGASTWSFADLDFDPRAFAGPQFRVSAPIQGYVVVTRP
jgi:hypothetical protein